MNKDKESVDAEEASKESGDADEASASVNEPTLVDVDD